MRDCIVGLKKHNYSKNLIGDFLRYLQSELPLKRDVRMVFTDNREGDMTTGIRDPNEIRILVKGRMLIDVFRTIAHEWVHEFQHQKLGVPDDFQAPSIGGPIENMPSVLSSIFIKKFQRDFPKYNKELYQQVSSQSK